MLSSLCSIIYDIMICLGRKDLLKHEIGHQSFTDS